MSYPLPLARWLKHLPAAPRLAAKLLGRGRPSYLVLFGPVSYGDDLLCTAIFRELRRRGYRQLWMMSRHPTLHEHNTDIDQVVPIDDLHALLLGRIGTRVVRPYCFGRSDDGLALVPPPRPLIAQMCFHAGLTGPIDIRPYLNLRPDELAAGRIHARQVVMHSSGRSAGFSMANKEWFPERFQQVADALNHRGFQVVQLGSPLDPPLSGVTDLRGRTPLRTSAAIISASRFVVCQVGFLMHLARAVDTRAVVIFGGVEDPALTGYSANLNLTTAPACAVCWRPDICPHERVCMTEITPQRVLAAALEIDSLHGTPLPLETYAL